MISGGPGTVSPTGPNQEVLDCTEALWGNDRDQQRKDSPLTTRRILAGGAGRGVSGMRRVVGRFLGMLAVGRRGKAVG